MINWERLDLDAPLLRDDGLECSSDTLLRPARLQLHARLDLWGSERQGCESMHRKRMYREHSRHLWGEVSFSTHRDAPKVEHSPRG